MKYIKTFESQKGKSFMDWLLKTYPDKNEWKYIREINCQYQNLINLDGIENLVNLKYLYCYNNQLTKLNLENLINLKVLYCYNNQLTELNLDKLVNLEYLYCEYNLLTELNLDNLNLKHLNCSNNKLPYNNLYEYNKWFEKTYPEKVAAKRYNL